MPRRTLLQLAQAAAPLYDTETASEEGSERQIEAENAFFDACRIILPVTVVEALENACHKAALSERIAAGLEAVTRRLPPSFGLNPAAAAGPTSFHSDLLELELVF